MIGLYLCLLLLLLSKEVKLEFAIISAFPNEPFSFGRKRAPSPLPLDGQSSYSSHETADLQLLASFTKMRSLSKHSIKSP